MLMWLKSGILMADGNVHNSSVDTLIVYCFSEPPFPTPFNQFKISGASFQFFRYLLQGTARVGEVCMCIYIWVDSTRPPNSHC